MDTCFVVCLWSNIIIIITAIHCKNTFTFHKVVRRHYSGDAGEFIILLCEISSGFCPPKIIKIGYFFLSYSKYKKKLFLRRCVYSRLTLTLILILYIYLYLFIYLFIYVFVHKVHIKMRN